MSTSRLAGISRLAIADAAASGYRLFGRIRAIARPFVAPAIAGRAHSITADVTIPEGGAEGVIIAEGGRLGGFTLYVKNGRAVYEANAFGNSTGRIVSADSLPAGKVRIVLDFTVDAKVDASGGIVEKILALTGRPGIARLTVNGTPAGEAPIAGIVPIYHETLDIGSDLGSPVSADYATPFNFTGQIDKVVLELK